MKISADVLARFKARSSAPPKQSNNLAKAKIPTIDLGEEANGQGNLKKKSAAKRKGRDRASVSHSDEQRMEFYIDLSHDPKPKKRPRTMMNMKVISDAFLASKGNLGRFKALLRDPVTNKNRAQVTITPKDTVDYENFIRDEVKKAIGDRLPFEGPVRIEMLFVLKGSATEWPTSPADGDADNLEKAAADALNEIAFKDDRFVVVTTRYKICREKPGLLLWLSPALPGDLEHPMIKAWDARRG